MGHEDADTTTVAIFIKPLQVNADELTEEISRSVEEVL
jgi:hypothetical protein